MVSLPWHVLEKLSTNQRMTQDYRIHNLSTHQHSRQTVTQHILNKVNEAFDLIQAEYFDAYSNYSRVSREAVLSGRTEALEGETEEYAAAREDYLLLEQRLTEAWMATNYFNYMLINLERSQAAADMLTMNAPSTAAPLDQWLRQSMTSSQDSTQRTYHSRESRQASPDIAFLTRP